jgi:hypothetical protein
MMRKLIWGGVALAVCGGVAVCTAAHYAAEHPDSFLARCANAAAYVGSRCSPLLTFTSKPVKHSKAVQAEIVCRPVRGHVPAVQDEQVPVDAVPEAFEPIVIENPLPFVEDLERRIDALDPGRFVTEATVVIEESEEPPHALTYDSVGIPRMPYADEEDACVDEISGDCDWQELLGWFWGCSPRHAAACVPHCHFQMTLERMIECIRDTPGAAAYTEESPAIVPVEGDEALEDASATGDDEEAQDETGTDTGTDECEEDRKYQHPYYQHHYQSCPYTGRCVYPHSIPYQIVVPRDMQRPVSTPVPENVAEPEESEAPTPPRKKKYIFNGTQVVPAHCEIDTLECRPSDGPEDYDLDEPF